MSWQPGMTLASVEREVILAALRFYNGNKVQTAMALGVAPKTIYNRLEAYEKADKAEQEKLSKPVAQT